MEPLVISEDWCVKKERVAPNFKIIGIAGKKQSGKTTLAYILSSRFNKSRVAPFAAALKGANLFNLGVISFRPQWDIRIRQALQNSGMSGRDLDEDLWIKVWQACFANAPADIFIIPDVRFPNEIQFIKKHNGVIIYLNKVDIEEKETHPSEMLSPDLCDYIVDFTDNTRRDAYLQVLDYVSRQFPDEYKHFAIPKVYISSNVQESQSLEIFNILEEEAYENGFEPLIPPDIAEKSWAQKLHKEIYSQACKNLVISDISLITEAHATFIYMYKPSIGCGMEMLASALLDKPTVLVTNLSLLTHPWLFSWSSCIVWHDRESAWRHLKEVFLI